MINKLVLRSPAARWKLTALARLLRALQWLKKGVQVGGVACGTLVLIQLLYPGQWTRPFVKLDSKSIGGWSSAKLTGYLTTSVANRPYNLALTNHKYKFSPATLGISVNTAATTTEATHYSLAQRLIPFSLFARMHIVEKKRVDQAKLSSSLKEFAAARAQDPVNATLARQNNVYTAVVPGKAGYVVNVNGLESRLTAATIGSHLEVPRTTVPPKITQQMLESALNDWRQQTDKPIGLALGGQLVTIPAATLQNWAQVTPNEAQSAVLITYDTTAIHSWLAGYAPRVYVAPKPAVRYIEDDALKQVTPGSAGTSLDIDTSADTIVSTLKAGSAPVRLASASLKPIAFSTQEVRTYSPTSKGLQVLINDWAAHYKQGTVAVSLQEIGGQSRSAALNDNGQFFTASIYKLFVVAYTYHLIEANQLDPNSLVLGAGKSVSDCLEATIVVSDNTCPEALGGQLGWLNIGAYANQQGFTATSLVDHNWSTDTHDVMNYLSKLNAGTLINGGDTATLLDKMQRQVYRSAIPAGSPGSQVQNKVGFYASYWHDAAIVHSPKATYILVVFTNGPGSGAIKSLATQIQQTINQ